VFLREAVAASSVRMFCAVNDLNRSTNPGIRAKGKSRSRARAMKAATIASKVCRSVRSHAVIGGPSLDEGFEFSGQRLAGRVEVGGVSKFEGPIERVHHSSPRLPRIGGPERASKVTPTQARHQPRTEPHLKMIASAVAALEVGG
jgi:hypothetical protein